MQVDLVDRLAPKTLLIMPLSTLLLVIHFTPQHSNLLSQIFVSMAHKYCRSSHIVILTYLAILACFSDLQIAKFLLGKRCLLGDHFVFLSYQLYEMLRGSTYRVAKILLKFHLDLTCLLLLTFFYFNYKLI